MHYNPIVRFRSLAAILLLIALLEFSADRCQAQATTGQIIGQASDPTGAAVRGAAITATDERKGVSFCGQTDLSCIDSVLSVPSGIYSVPTFAPGFGEAKFAHSVLAIDQLMALNFKLKLATSPLSCGRRSCLGSTDREG